MDNMDFVPPPSFKPDKITKEAIDLVDKIAPESRGISKDFRLPVTRKDVRRWYDDFIENRLKLFGMYQDAMVMGNY